jgi:predicted O-methyltransferase YrrM
MISTTLDDAALQMVLSRLHAHDSKNRWNWVRAAVPAIIDGWLGLNRSATVRAKRDRKLALCLTPAAGRLAYLTGRAIRARRIIEFGTSFGVSTLYLAAAVRDNGGGVVVGSELEPSKVLKARMNVAEAGLADFVDIRAGDARETLADAGGVIDMVLLDGSKDLYLPVLQILEPHLRPGSVVLADDVILFKQTLAPYVAHMQDKTNGFQSVTLPIGAGLEYSVRLDLELKSSSN